MRQKTNSDQSVSGSDVHLPRVTDQRTANLIGALALAISDRVNDAIGEVGAGGPSASAALTALRTYQDVAPHALPVVSIERLRRIIGLSHSATVRLVDRLSNDGLVERWNSVDGREAALRLTPAGNRAAQRTLSERQRVLDEVLAVLDTGERQALTTALERMLAAITGGRWQARNICRLCDYGVCVGNPFCPVEDAATALAR